MKQFYPSGTLSSSRRETIFFNQKRSWKAFFLFAFILTGLYGSATELGHARISNVEGTNGSCVVSTTNGGGIQFWDIAAGGTYDITLSDVNDAGNGGTDATIQVIVKSSSGGNTCVTATKVGTGVYTFSFSPGSAFCNTMPILYATSNCSPSTGKWARNNNPSNAEKLGHLRIAQFDGNCSKTGVDQSCSIQCEAVCNISGDDTICVGESTEFCAPMGFDYAWSNNSIDRCITVSEAGVYGLTVTDANGCSVSCSVTLVIDIPRAFPVSPSGPAESCFGTCVTLTASGGSSYLWSGPGVNGQTGNTIQACQSGSYSVTGISAPTGCPVSPDSIAPVQVTIFDAPVVVIGTSGSTSICEEECVTLTLNNLTAFQSWTWDNGSTSASREVCAEGTYIINVTDTNGCPGADTVEVTVHACVDHCSLTQGFYGNSGGKYCDGRTTTQLLSDLLQTPLVIGVSGVRSLTITSNDVACVIQRLPGGGPAAVLPPHSSNQLPADMTFTGNCSTTPFAIPTKNGRFRNILLAQTITLGLNLRLGTDLGSLAITGPYLVTAAQQGGGCADSTVGPVDGTEECYAIPQTVLNYLGSNNTVQDLFNLANAALAGQVTTVDLSSISSAVQAFNDGFDECREFIEFTGVQCNVFKGDREMAVTEDEMDATLRVYPNPFGNTANVEFTMEQTTQLKVEVLDATGKSVKVLFNGMAQENENYSLPFNSSTLANGLYIVRFVTDETSVQKRIVLQR